MKSQSYEKTRARLQAKSIRAAAHNAAAGVELIKHWPAQRFRGRSVAGFWPIKDEIDPRPLMTAIHESGSALFLPAIKRAAHPLIMRSYAPGDALVSGAYNTKEPTRSQVQGYPDVVLVPLLAFTPSGDRLGYGGGYYDRTLQALSQRGSVFACGVAYAAQEAPILPTGPYDRPLDAILTERGFTEFK